MLLSFVYQHLNFQWKLISWQYTWPEVQRPWDRVYSAADLYNLLAKVLQVGMISWTVGFYDVPYHGSERFLEFIYNSGMSHSSPSLYMEKKSLMTSTGRIPCSCGTTEKFISAYDTSVGFFNSFLWFSYLREYKKNYWEAINSRLYGNGIGIFELLGRGVGREPTIPYRRKKKASLSMKIKDHLRNISARFT